MSYCKCSRCYESVYIKKEIIVYCIWSNYSLWIRRPWKCTLCFVSSHSLTLNLFNTLFVLFGEQRYVSLQDNNGMLSRCLRSTRRVKGETSPFPLCTHSVWASSTPPCTSSPDTRTSPHFDSLPNKMPQQCQPVFHFVISGNRWTSPKPLEYSCIFPFPVRKLRGQRMILLQTKGQA